MYTGNTDMIPDNGMKCVWMTSGLISYKLCSLDFRCEDCAFDRVMHTAAVTDMHRQDFFSSPTVGAPPTDPSTNRLDGSLFYHKNHCWIKVANPYEVVIGINGILAKLMCGIQTVVLPQIGDPAIKNQVFAHVMLDKHIVPLIMPVQGEITAINATLEKQPELLREEYGERGWLVTVKADNLENDLRTLSFGSRAMEWYRAKESSVNEAICAAYNTGREHVGATMYDGGELVLNASEILTSEQYSTILDELSR